MQSYWNIEEDPSDLEGSSGGQSQLRNSLDVFAANGGLSHAFPNPLAHHWNHFHHNPLNDNTQVR
jgi:hypothetical protein